MKANNLQIVNETLLAFCPYINKCTIPLSEHLSNIQLNTSTTVDKEQETEYLFALHHVLSKLILRLTININWKSIKGKPFYDQTIPTI